MIIAAMASTITLHPDHKTIQGIIFVHLISPKWSDSISKNTSNIKFLHTKREKVIISRANVKKTSVNDRKRLI